MQPECAAEGLRRIIVESFPSYPFRGPVMAVSNAPSVYEVETDNLDSVPGGKESKELSDDFLDANQDEYVLMNDSASWHC